MPDSILDTIMGTLKGIEKDEATLTVEEGGKKIDLFGPGNEDAYKIGDDFDTIIKSLLSDEQGQKIYTNLIESGNIDQLKDLWEMGGSPSLEYTDSVVLEADPKHPATYSKGGHKFSAKGRGPFEKGVTYIHGGYEVDSFDKFNRWVAELSHGIGYNNPSMMKLGKKEYRDKTGKLLGVNTMEPTLDFISALGSLPEPQSPADSLNSYRNWKESLPAEIPRHGGHGVEGSPENITHSQIESALHWWLQDKLDIPFQDKSLWGYEY